MPHQASPKPEWQSVPVAAGSGVKTGDLASVALPSSLFSNSIERQCPGNDRALGCLLAGLCTTQNFSHQC